MEKYAFQYCQKIVIFSPDKLQVLLCKRKGEADYDGMYSFIGDKMEITDATLLAGLQREKNEEIGAACKLKIYPTYSTNHYFVKKDGSHMILPHYFAIHISGPITLNDEYSDYQWVPLDKLLMFKPKIPTIPDVVEKLLRVSNIFTEKEFVLI